MALTLRTLCCVQATATASYTCNPSTVTKAALIKTIKITNRSTSVSAVFGNNGLVLYNPSASGGTTPFASIVAPGFVLLPGNTLTISDELALGSWDWIRLETLASGTVDVLMSGFERDL